MRWQCSCMCSWSGRQGSDPSGAYCVNATLLVTSYTTSDTSAFVAWACGLLPRAVHTGARCACKEHYVRVRRCRFRSVPCQEPLERQ